MNDDVRFLTELFSPYERGYIEIRGLNGPPGTRRTTQEWFPITEPAAAAAFAHTLDADGYSAYVGVLPRDLHDGHKKSVTQAAWLWADLDLYKRSKGSVVRALDIHPPDMLVNSGGGFHCYWRLSQVLDLSDPRIRGRFEKALSARLKEVGSDPVHNLDRILRVPGTNNRKTLPMKKVAVIEWPRPKFQSSEWLPEARNASYSRSQRLFHRLQHRAAVGIASEGVFALYRERYLHAR